MNNIYNAYSLALLSQLGFAVFADNVDAAVQAICLVVNIFGLRYVVVDLAAEPDATQLAEQITYSIPGDTDVSETVYLASAVIFRNLETVSAKYQRLVIHFINALESYNTNALRLRPLKVRLGQIEAQRPQLFTLVAAVRRNLDGMPPAMVPHLRHKFAFAQFYNDEAAELHQGAFPVSTSAELLTLRRQVDEVFVSPEIRGYIYSLLVHVRTHRLCSLNSMGGRPPTAALDWTRILAAAMVVWSERLQSGVTGKAFDTESLATQDREDTKGGGNGTETSGTKYEPGDSERELNGETNGGLFKESEKNGKVHGDNEVKHFADEKVEYAQNEYSDGAANASFDRSDTTWTFGYKSGVSFPAEHANNSDESREENLARDSESSSSTSSPSSLFVTPTFVKVAFRKVTYFQVDWELDTIFSRSWTGPEEHRRQEISMLTGDWYGSEWVFVERYIDEHRSRVSEQSPTGYTNSVVEEAISRVRPPI